MEKVIVIGIYRNRFALKLLENRNNSILYGQISSSFMKKLQEKNLQKENHVTIGDIVYVEKKNSIYFINGILKRKNAIIRSSTNKKQIIAVNIDQVIIVSSFQYPLFNHNFLDRVLVEVQNNNIPLILVLNKQDLKNTLLPKKKLEQNFQFYHYQKIGIQIFQENVIHKISLELKDALQKKTSLLIGESGVGKSTFFNTLFQKNIRKVPEYSILKRGKHTTTNSIMYSFNINSNIVDTPGIVNFGLHHIDCQKLASLFPEFQEYICEYRNCTHIYEKKCQVQKAVIDKKIPHFRYKSYIQIYNHSKNKNQKK